MRRAFLERTRASRVDGVRVLFEERLRDAVMLVEAEDSFLRDLARFVL